MSNANPAPGSNGVTSIDIMKMMGLRKSTKLARQDIAEINVIHKTTRVSFQFYLRFREFTLILPLCALVTLLGILGHNGILLLVIISFHLRCCSLMKNL
jgi:hypothetical protein